MNGQPTPDVVYFDVVIKWFAPARRGFHHTATPITADTHGDSLVFRKWLRDAALGLPVGLDPCTVLL